MAREYAPQSALFRVENKKPGSQRDYRGPGYGTNFRVFSILFIHCSK